MFRFAYVKAVLLGIVILAGSLSAATAAVPYASPSVPSPGTARVWFLRAGAPDGRNTLYGAVPEIYANGTPVGSIPHNSRFYRDLAPGTYRFTVQSYGLPNDEADTVQLAPGSISYIWVEAAPPWQFGYVGGRGGSNRRSFFVYSVTPEIAQSWFQAMTDLGQG
jgi:hypothetical protein